MGAQPPINKKRVLIGVVDTAGYGSRLLRGFRELGHDCWFVGFGQDRFAYQDDDPSAPWILHQLLAIRHQAKTRAAPARWWWKSIELAWRCLFFIWALCCIDLFIFVSGWSFFGALDLRLLRLCRRRVVVVFMGSDSRPPYLNGGRVTRPLDADRLDIFMDKQLKRLRRAERDADWIISHPASSQLHRRTFVPFLEIGFPAPAAATNTTPPSLDPNTPLRVMHAPSDPLGKGSASIRALIASLQQQGAAIEYHEVENLTNEQVLQRLADCDLLLDQLYSDTPMAGLATEAAALGKAVLVAGYAQDVLGAHPPDVELPPSLYVRPEDVQKTLQQLVDDRTRVRDLAAACRAFIEQHWQAKDVATRIVQLVFEPSPPYSLWSPESIGYVIGYGYAEADLQARLRNLSDQRGIAFFRLDADSAAYRNIREIIT